MNMDLDQMSNTKKIKSLNRKRNCTIGSKRNYASSELKIEVDNRTPNKIKGFVTKHLRRKAQSNLRLRNMSQIDFDRQFVNSSSQISRNYNNINMNQFKVKTNKVKSFSIMKQDQPFNLSQATVLENIRVESQLAMFKNKNIKRMSRRVKSKALSNINEMEKGKSPAQVLKVEQPVKANQFNTSAINSRIALSTANLYVIGASKTESYDENYIKRVRHFKNKSAIDNRKDRK